LRRFARSEQEWVMLLGLTSIQRDRGPWVTEWFAFHYLVGFRKFYFYAHMCTDDTLPRLQQLQLKLDLTVNVIHEKMDFVQLKAFQHSCDHYLNQVDWMGFIDGDEFIFPTQTDSMQEALAPYQEKPLSALGVYNVTFGSSGHVTEPEGLITENYRRCNSSSDLMQNRRIKSLVRGSERASTSRCSHYFLTQRGTQDELGREITWGFTPDLEPTFQHFRMNHYATQSLDYFRGFKKKSGLADAGADVDRGDEWWTIFDQNVEHDTSVERFREGLQKTLHWLNS
jgi:hypothetical protein